jgi:large subunit ribosomal protein L6
MSRVGKSPIKIPTGVQINIAGHTVKVKGPKGELAYTFHENIKIEKKEDVVVLARPSDSKTDKALHGTSRALLNNMVTGVTTGFKKELEIRGVGYRGEQKGKNVSLLLGYSHPIEFSPPAGVSVKVDGNVKLIVEGIDRQVVGQVAATIRGFKPPEPYKGKGVRYSDEVVVQKEVKKT